MRMGSFAIVEVRKDGRVLLRCSPSQLLASSMIRSPRTEKLRDISDGLYKISLPFEVVTIIEMPSGARYEDVERIEEYDSTED